MSSRVSYRICEISFRDAYRAGVTAESALTSAGPKESSSDQLSAERRTEVVRGWQSIQMLRL